MTFKPGDEVVCVDDSPPRQPGERDRLVKGRIYIVEGIDPENGTGLYLAGMPGHVAKPFKHPFGWAPSRFRPVRKTSIEIFTSMLTPTPTKENVEA